MDLLLLGKYLLDLSINIHFVVVPARFINKVMVNSLVWRYYVISLRIIIRIEIAGGINVSRNNSNKKTNPLPPIDQTNCNEMTLQIYPRPPFLANEVTRKRRRCFLEQNAFFASPSLVLRYGPLFE